MSTKPVSFQDVASNIFNHTIQTSKEQCKKAEAKLKQVSPAAQDETYARVGAVGNGGVKNATLGRQILAKDLNYAGLTQQFCTVSSDVATCIEIQKLFAQKAKWSSSYDSLSAFAKKEIEEHLNDLGGNSNTYYTTLETAIAAYIQKYDPLLANANAASPSGKPMSYEKREYVVVEILYIAKVIKYDLGIAIAYKTTIDRPINENRPAKVREAYGKFSRVARLVIDRLLIANNPSAATPSEANGKPKYWFAWYTVASDEEVRNATLTFFHDYLGDDAHYNFYDEGVQGWMATKEDRLTIQLYMKVASLIREVLPTYDSGKPISDAEFEQNLKSFLQTADLTEYSKIMEHFDEEMTSIVFGEKRNGIFTTIMDSDSEREDCIRAVNQFDPEDKEDFRLILLDMHQVAIENAQKTQLSDAAANFAKKILSRHVAQHTAKTDPSSKQVQEKSHDG